MFSLSHSKKVRALFEEHWLFSSVLLWSGFIATLSLAYITIGINRWSAIGISLFFLFLIYQAVFKKLPNFPIVPENNVRLFGLLCAIILDIVLLRLLWIARTDIPLQSPWTQISPSFFILFAATTFLLFSSLWNSRPTLLHLVATSSHLGIFYGITVVVFRLGYAFDPIIHQAAENYIVAHGKITPLQPFYIGQYALVSTLHFLTNAPVWLIDRLLLPLLAIISLPIIGFFGLTRGWKVPTHYFLIVLLCNTILALPELTFTVPHNISVVILIWWILLLPWGIETSAGKTSLFALAISATLFHPLLGIPLCIASAFLLLPAKRFISILGSIIIGVTLCAMLGIYRLQHGDALAFSFNGFQNFAHLFFFSNTIQKIRPALQLLYGLNYLTPYIIVIVGIFCAYKSPPHIRRTLFSLAGGLFFAIFLISTFITIPGIAPYEQNEFVLRIKNIIPLLFIPFITRRLYELIKPFIFIGGISILITISLYFTYPGIDGSQKPGWNIGSGDIAVATSIETLANGKPYIVLSNQILAVAGLRERGFEKRLKTSAGIDTYPFAIGPNEPIYPLTEEVLYRELNGPNIRAYAKIIEGTVFIAVHDYWFRAARIADEARIAGADETYRFDGITVYKFQ